MYLYIHGLFINTVFKRIGVQSTRKETKRVVPIRLIRGNFTAKKAEVIRHTCHGHCTNTANAYNS